MRRRLLPDSAGPASARFRHAALVAAAIGYAGSLRALAELMCGHELRPPARRPQPRGRALLELRGVSVAGERGHRPRLTEVDLAVHAGEIVGVAGVSGNGQRELAEVIAGVLKPSAGSVAVR